MLAQSGHHVLCAVLTTDASLTLGNGAHTSLHGPTQRAALKGIAQVTGQHRVMLRFADLCD